MLRNPFARTLMLAAGVILFTGAAAAQVKLAVIDIQQAVLGTAEAKAGMSALETKYKPRQAEIDKLRAEIDDIQKRLQAGNLTPQAEADLTAQGQRKQRDFQRLAQDANDEFDADRNELFNRAGQRMRQVIQKLAEERGMDVVVEANSALYTKPALDLTKDAIAAFDKAYPPKP